MSGRRWELPLAIVLGVVVRYPFWVEAEKTPVDGDTAIIGLMARHPASSVTMWGQPYGSPVEAWFAAHPRYHRHFTPTGASWLNLVERFFAEITDKRIRRGTFRSVGELVRAIRDYIRRRNHSPQPFVWTASARSIARKVRHCNEALETGH